MNNKRHANPATRLVAAGSGALALALALILGGASAAGASCLGPTSVDTSLREADLAFVGTAVAVTNNGRWATFSVEEVWKGDPGGQRIEVRGGPGGQVATSVDRTYVAGTRYLVFARDPGAHGSSRSWGDDGRWEDGGCSATQPYTADLDNLRPQDASGTGAGITDNPPVPRSQPRDQRSWPSLPLAAGFAIAALGAVAVAAAAAVGRVGPREA